MKMAKKCSSDLAWFGIERQNLGTFLENKVHWKSKLSKNILNKNYLPFLYSSMKQAQKGFRPPSAM